MAVKGLRPLRVARFIQEELASIILKDVKDDRLKDIIVSHVKVSPDLREATVYYRTLVAGDADQKQSALEKATPYLQKVLKPHLHMRWAPRLKFVFDEQLEKTERLEELLTRIHRENADV